MKWASVPLPPSTWIRPASQAPADPSNPSGIAASGAHVLLTASYRQAADVVSKKPLTPPKT
jgi:hypothetical protein